MSEKDSWKPGFDRTKLGTVLPTKFPTPAEHEANLPKQEVTDYSASLPVDTGAQQQNKPATGSDLADKIYMFPESYNALRRELCENYPRLWDIVGHAMAFDAIIFIEYMDDALGIKTTWDSAKVGAICHRYWNELRMKRGLADAGPYGDGSGTLRVTKDGY